ncbi:hypothetical protein BR93DRAFT_965481 [Coniochaeta sp. PMI_546]|nr:hypothetical protein BR93DRAFT_965481 [Coniochaeta sp. PMI_546]
MERRIQNLTLKLLIFEIIHGRRTFTDEAAEDLLLLSPQESAWLVTVRKIETAGSTVGDVEPTIRLVHRTITIGSTPSQQKEAEHAIEILCREFCDPARTLFPGRVNANPYLVFTVGVDVNNPIDDIFLRTFLKYSSRFDKTRSGTSKADGIPGWGAAVARVTPSLLGYAGKVMINALKDSSEVNNPAGSNIMSTAGVSAALIAILEHKLDNLIKDGNVGDVTQRDQARPTTTALDHAILAFAGIDKVFTDYKAAGAIAVPGSTRPILESLRDSMSAITREQWQAKVSANNAKYAGGTVATLFLTSLIALGCDMLVPSAVVGLSDSVPQLWRACWQLIPLGSGVGGIYLRNHAEKAVNVASRLSDADMTIHRRLYLMAHDALRSDYHRRPDAAVFARLALDMAALVNPAALEAWEPRLASREDLDRELRLLGRNVTAELVIESWLDTRVFSAAASWVVYPQGRDGVDSGVVNSLDYRPWYPPSSENGGRVEFRSAYDKEPKDFAARSAILTWTLRGT